MNFYGNWSGYQSPPASGYNYAEMAWTVTSISPVVPSDPTNSYEVGPQSDLSVWPGIGTGDSKTDELVQAGVEQDSYATCETATSCTETIGAPFFWYEQYPRESEEPLNSVPVQVNNSVDVLVQVTSNTAYFTFCNKTSKKCTESTQAFQSGEQTGSQVEWIGERPALSNGDLTALAKFGTLDISNATGGTSASPQTVQALGGEGNVMTTCTAKPERALALPSTLGSDGESFNIVWQDYGAEEPYAGC